MPTHQRIPLAKEMVDQAIRHVKKQRKNATRKQPEQKPKERHHSSRREPAEKKFEPSAEFYTIFTEMIGSDEHTTPPQETPKGTEFNQKEEIPDKPAQQSVFEVLSRRGNKDKRTRN